MVARAGTLNTCEQQFRWVRDGGDGRWSGTGYLVEYLVGTCTFARFLWLRGVTADLRGRVSEHRGLHHVYNRGSDVGPCFKWSVDA